MNNKQEIICIVCPIGCKIRVQKQGLKVNILNGNKCKKGVKYATVEMTDPKRVLTTSVLVHNGEWPLVSVKSTKPVPKEKIFTILHMLQKIRLEAPVKVGQSVIKNVAHTKLDIIATKTVNKRSE